LASASPATSLRSNLRLDPPDNLGFANLDPLDNLGFTSLDPLELETRTAW
jgi:hypothetical protein